MAVSDIVMILEELRSDGSTIHKKEVLAKFVNHEAFKKFLDYAYNNEYLYFFSLKSVKEPENSMIDLMNEEESEEALWNTLDAMKKGNMKREAVNIAYSLFTKDCKDIFKLIINHDVRAGINVKTINEIFGNFIPVTPYMGAVPYRKENLIELFKNHKKVFSEVKMDGRYANFIINENTEMSIISRQGKPTYLFGAIEDDAKLVFEQTGLNGSGITLNGELTMDGFDRYTANGIISSIVSIGNDHMAGKDIVKKKEKFKKSYGMSIEEAASNVTFVCWDYIPYQHYCQGSSYMVPREERMKNIEKWISESGSKKIKMIEYRVVNNATEALAHFNELLLRGDEGTVVKGSEGIWENKKPDYQIKVKIEITVDLKIVGFKNGNIGTKNENRVASLICESSDGIVKADPGAMTDFLMDDITENKEKYLGMIVSVISCGTSRDSEGNWSLLHPRVGVPREGEKDEADSLEMILEIERSAKEAS